MNLKTKMEKVINNSYSNIGGIVALKKGEKVYENYFNEFTSDNNVHIFSVTKSIISILIGIAIARGNIESVDKRVLDYFPEYEVQKGEKTIFSITIRDLLTMTAPYKYKSDSNAIYSKYFESSDWVKSSLDYLGGSGKIGEFRYTPIIGPDILSGILVKATGQSVIDFANENLFLPLRITAKDNIIFHNKEEQMAFYKAKNPSGWVMATNGVNTAGWGLSLTALDMAKIGQLYLNDGMWEGKQIVSESWINESTVAHSKGKEWKLSYGYLWWIIDEKEHIYAAMGDGGNIIYVNESKEMVVSISSIYEAKAKDRIKLIREYVEVGVG